MGEKGEERIGIIFILFGAYILCGVPEYLADTECPYLIRAASYSFFHASWWHLAVNCLAVWTIYRKPCKPCRDLVIPFLIAMAVYPLSFRPVIGFSNVLYAVLGLRTPPLSSPWWKRSEVYIFIAVTLAMAFIPRFSATTHIAAFLLGMAGASIRRGWIKLTRDARRYY